VSRITTKGALEATATALFEISSYLPFGSPSDMDAGNGGSISNVFDLNGRLSTSNTGAARERQYTYYAGGSLQSITASGTPWQNRTYTYDPLNRLKDALGPYGLLDYTYDSAGNRETLNGHGYTYVPGTNRIATDEAGKTYSYDANGNITAMGNRSLIYNQRNELVRVREGTGVLGEYTYNGLGERVIKKTGSTTYYVYDFDGNLIAESSPDGQISTEYLYQGRSRLARVDANSAIFFYHNDQLGTPQLMADQQNTVVWEATYNPFGEAGVHSGSSVTNNFRFQGQYFDAETGFHYNYFRYYDPKTGRYTATG
jgi:YD repeat-containing protein